MRALLLLPLLPGLLLQLATANLHVRAHLRHPSEGHHGKHDNENSWIAMAELERWDCPHKFEPNCHMAGRMAIVDHEEGGGRKMLRWFPYTSSRWGNALSPYWQARAMAHLGGMEFSSDPGFNNFWLEYLPTSVPKESCGDEAAFKHACATCEGPAWEFAHMCTNAWKTIRPIIQHDTHVAFERWLAANNASRHVFKRWDVAVQLRCAADTLLSHPEYGPIAFSFYNSIDHHPEVEDIYVVTDPGIDHAPCRALVDEVVSYLRGRYPGRGVHVVGGAIWEDWARLMYAPILFKDSGSFGLWAGLASFGITYSAPLKALHADQTTPDLTASWIWVDAPVLYPEAAAAANLTLDDFPGILRWLREH